MLRHSIRVHMVWSRDCTTEYQNAEQHERIHSYTFFPRLFAGGGEAMQMASLSILLQSQEQFGIICFSLCWIDSEQEQCSPKYFSFLLNNRELHLNLYNKCDDSTMVLFIIHNRPLRVSSQAVTLLIVLASLWLEIFTCCGSSSSLTFFWQSQSCKASKPQNLISPHLLLTVAHAGN